MFRLYFYDVRARRYRTGRAISEVAEVTDWAVVVDNKGHYFIRVDDRFVRIKTEEARYCAVRALELSISRQAAGNEKVERILGEARRARYYGWLRCATRELRRAWAMLG